MMSVKEAHVAVKGAAQLARVNQSTHLMEIFLDASMAESRWSITLTPLTQDSISNQRRTNSINLNKSVAHRIISLTSEFKLKQSYIPRVPNFLHIPRKPLPDPDNYLHSSRINREDDDSYKAT